MNRDGEWERSIQEAVESDGRSHQIKALEVLLEAGCSTGSLYVLRRMDFGHLRAGRMGFHDVGAADGSRWAGGR